MSKPAAWDAAGSTSTVGDDGGANLPLAVVGADSYLLQLARGLLHPFPLLLGQKTQGGGVVMLEGGRQRGCSCGIYQRCWPFLWRGSVSLLPTAGKALPWSQRGAREDCMAESKGWLNSENPAGCRIVREMESPSLAGLRIGFETRDPLQLRTMLRCQRDGLNYLIGRCCLPPAICLSRTYIQLGYFSWEDKAFWERPGTWRGEREEHQPGRCPVCFLQSMLLRTWRKQEWCSWCGGILVL